MELKGDRRQRRLGSGFCVVVVVVVLWSSLLKIIFISKNEGREGNEEREDSGPHVFQRFRSKRPPEKWGRIVSQRFGGGNLQDFDLSLSYTVE
jgi:hypothetical protein